MNPRPRPSAGDETPKASALQPVLIPADVLAELRLAMLSDLHSATEELVAIIEEAERNILAVSLDENGQKIRERCEAAVRAIELRHRLHAAIGFPGQPLRALTLADEDQFTLATAVLTEYREAHVARLAHDVVPPALWDTTAARVQLVTTFLRYARVAVAEEAIAITDMRPRSAR